MSTTTHDPYAATLTPSGISAGASPLIFDGTVAPGGDRKFRPDIQGLRAIAVLIVVLYHAGLPGISGGFVGVDVFFVISGFLISRELINESLTTGSVSLSRFYARRIRRILPSALVVILVTMIVARIWGPVLQAAGVAHDGFFAAIYSLNYSLAAAGIDYQHAGAAVSPLQHFWSLAVEEQFYIVWPILILGAALITRGRLRALRPYLVGLVILVIAGVSFNQSVTVTATNAPLAYFSLQTRGWELAAGGLVAIAIPLLRRIPGVLASIMSWVGIGAIAYSAFTFTGATPFPGTLAIIPVGGAVLVIAGGLLKRRGSAELILSPRPMQFLGRVSYGWYLWHWPAIVLAPFIFHITFSWVENLEISILALWFATLSYLVLERASTRKTISRRRWFAIGASMTSVVVCVALSLMLLAPQPVAAAGKPATPLNAQLTSATLGAAIAAGTRATQLPSNIQPTLTTAATDVPLTSNDGCHLNFAQVDQPACVFGDLTATRTILLIGDSHAEQWFGAVNAFGQREGWKVVSWTKAACPIADVVLYNEQINRQYTECGAWRDSMLSAIKKLAPDLIIASQTDTLPGPTYSDAAWASKTQTTVRSLKSLAPSVVFLADTPHPTLDIPGCVAAHPTSIGDCTVAAYPAGQSARRAAVAAAMSQLGVPVIDPRGWFCTPAGCPAVVANDLVYRDASHMTQHYSIALEPVLATALKNYLPSTTSK